MAMINAVQRHPLWIWPIAVVLLVGVLAIANAALAVATDPLIQVANDGIKAGRLAQSPAEKRPCPAKWEDVAARDEHSRVISCKKDSWVVILQESGAPSHAYEANTPNAKFVFPGNSDWFKVGWPK